MLPLSNLSKMAGPLRFIFLSAIIAVFCYGVYDVLNNFEINGCQMTYMFEYPEYIKVKNMRKDVKEMFPKYNLYFYGEGHSVVQRNYCLRDPWGASPTVRRYAAESKNMKLKGIPVLFIPGNAGSYKQVRSLGSVALRMAQDMKTPFHFNYFAVDLNEEYSALFGGVLEAQTVFTHECIKHILSLYKGSPTSPRSVLLVGHSMGGMIARALFTLTDFNQDQVHTIFTQATPHQVPVISLDPYIISFYSKVNIYWEENANGSLNDVTVFSSGGGFRDFQVRTQLTSLSGLVLPDRGISSLTMSVPRAWASTDHRCHVWCKQIVLATKRAIFDMVDKSTKQIAVNPRYRMMVVGHHFIRNPGPKNAKMAYDQMVPLDSEIKWETRKKLSWSIGRDSLTKTRYSVLEIPKGEEYAFVAISNIENEEWLGACSIKAPKTKSKDKKEKDELCKQMGNMAPWADLIPSHTSRDYKVAHLNNFKIDEFTHLITILPASKKRVEVMAEIYNVTARHITYNITMMWEFLKNFPRGILARDVVVNETDKNAVFYNISLQGLDIPLQAYTAHVTPVKCKDGKPSGSSWTGAKFFIPWSNDHTYSVFSYGEEGNVSLKLQSGKPRGFPLDSQLHVYLHPSCTYQVTVSISWSELCGQFVRFYSPFLPAYLAIQVLMVLSWQLKMLDEEAQVPNFLDSHSRWAKPWRVVPVSVLLRLMLTFPEEESLSKRLGLLPDDSAVLNNLDMWYQLSALLLYMTSYAMVGIYAYIVQLIVKVLASVFNCFFGRCCNNPSCTKALKLIQYALLLLAFAASVEMCGTIGIVITYVIYVFKLFSSYIKAQSGSQHCGFSRSKFHLNFTILLLLLIAYILNAPSLIVWIKDIKYSHALDVDPSKTTGIVVVLAALTLNYADFPNVTSEVYSLVGNIIYISCVIMVLYATYSVHRICYFINTTLTMVASAALLMSRFAPSSSDVMEQIPVQSDDDILDEMIDNRGDDAQDDSGSDKLQDETNNSEPEVGDEENDDPDWQKVEMAEVTNGEKKPGIKDSEATEVVEETEYNDIAEDESEENSEEEEEDSESVDKENSPVNTETEEESTQKLTDLGAGDNKSQADQSVTPLSAEDEDGDARKKKEGTQQ